jgi:hypothetical protein
MERYKLLIYSVLVLVLASLVLEPAFGQRWKLRRYEIGGGLGMTQVFGDIGGTINQRNWFGLRDIKLDETSMVFPIYVRYKIDPVYSVKTNLALGFGHGDDIDSRNNRGRSYKTMLTELSVQGEYYIVPEEKRYKSAAMFNRRGMINNYMSFGVYTFVGIGATYSRASVNFTQEQYPFDKIVPNSIGVVFPFGLGIKYILDDQWQVGSELGYRYSLNDFIDGYTQELASKHNDVYYFLSLSLCYKLETSRRGIPGFLDKDYRISNKTRKKGAQRPRNRRQALQ